MKFCLYLKDRGLIGADQLLAALEVQYELLPPLGQLAMEVGALSARQVFQVLRCQSDLPHERFGEVAVELGLLSPRELEHLLALQESRKPPLLDVLVQMGALSASCADRALADYRREMERRSAVTVQRFVSRPQPAAADPATPDSDGYALTV